MAVGQEERYRWTSRHFSNTRKLPCVGLLRILFIAFIHTTRANKQAFIQCDTVLEVLHFGDGGALPADSDINVNLYQQSTAPQGGSCRPIRFEPPMLDFHKQPVGMPKMEKVYLHNPSSEEISLISISATTAHFHASFFQNRIIPPGGNTSFDVVFLARVVGNVENTLFINTSHHGVFTYQVFGVGIPNPYRLRPFVGARVPVNSSFSPLINIHNPYSEPLQVVEIYSSGGDLHLELPTGQQGGTGKLWEIAPFETKGVMRASFSSRDEDNHTAFIRIKTNAPNEDKFIILPVEVEVTSAPGIYSSTEMLHFGTLRSQDRPKQMALYLLNSGTKDVPITSIRATPPNDAITIDFKAITLRVGDSKYTKVATISFDASKARRPYQFFGKITVKAKEKTYSKLEIPYQADVLEGYLGFDHTATLFHIRDSPVDPVDRPIFLTNSFSFAIRIHNVSLPEEAKTMFSVQNFTSPVLVPAHESRYIFSLLFQPVRPSIHIDSNILLITNASKFHLPIRAYTGFLEPHVLQPSLKKNILDFGIRSATDTSSIIFVVVNSNPIELEIRSWQVTGDSLSMELLKAEKGNATMASSRLRDLQNVSASHHKTVFIGSGFYAAFRVTLVANALEGTYDGAVHITTDYEILTIPVKALIAVGALTSSPKHLILPHSFPGKVVHQIFSVRSSFSQKVRLEQIRSLTEDIRFYYKRLRNNKDELEPKRKSKVANIYFDASLQCGDHCYVGLPFLFKSESKPHGMVLQEDIWDSDVDLHQKLLRRWNELKVLSGHIVEAMFEVNTDLQKNVQAKITAELIWPSLINSTRHVTFPLTNTNSSAEREITLQNPADVPVYVQVLPLALLPNPSIFSEKLLDRWQPENLSSINIDPHTMEFQVQRNQSTAAKSGIGFAEGSSRPFVYNLVLMPREVKSFNVRFTPVRNHSVSSLLIVRNNLTVIDTIVLHGHGTTESLKVAGKSPGHGSSLRFKMTEALLRECTDKKRIKDPTYTLKRTFRIENTGLLPITIRSVEINGQACEGFGFKVLNCQEFLLQPNTSEDLVILFTPDFTTSRVIRELKLVTYGGSEFLFVMNASLPYHMLAACAETLPRPTWEMELCIIVAVVMSSMFLLVIGTAYLEAQSIWEPYKRRVSVETNCTLETGRPFNLREIVQLHSESNDSSQTSRGLYGATNGATRGGRHGNSRTLSDSDVQDKRSRMSLSRSSMPLQAASSSNLPRGGSYTSGQEVATPPPNCQMTNRKARSAKPDLQGPSLATSSSPPQRGGASDTEYANLVNAMDTDRQRPESLVQTLDDQSSQLLHNKALESKGKLRGKTKVQRKKEEKVKKSIVKTPGDELKDNLADNDDTSSTTTETSNPDMEASIKEEPLKKKGSAGIPAKEETNSNFLIKQKPKKQGAAKKEVQAEKASSLELPYVTPLENKQRKGFTSKSHQPLTSAPKTRPVQNPKLEAKLEEGRSSLLAKLLSGSVQELGHSSSSEGEKEFASPEWDIPVCKNSVQADSLQQISIQTLNADPFLKRSSTPGACSPPPTSPSLLSRGTYSSVLNSNSDVNHNKAPGSKACCPAPLPGKNGNPTFAAVAAGYDKSPGGSGSGRVEGQSRSLAHTMSVESDSSDSSGLWSPIDTISGSNFNSTNSFSAFGPNNSFNLTGVFSGMSLQKPSEPQLSWPDFTTVPSSIWDMPSADPLYSWPASSSSPTAPTSSLLGSSHNPWSASAAFGNSIWSASTESSLHPYSPAVNSPTLTDPLESSPSPSADMSRTYNPWSMWRPTLGRRSSEPWPSPSEDAN
ncbi:transmembrane protein 131 isoform X1 [Hippocampus zosterae]|uniref:transmembrane protein 131 isoform X1 n=1 Tax=Hippocampus zosterae TaxID=109293 RepID=UPI00223D37FC|nr:transmembrane protein 131 isoform X1 [Hippocampus zosterae]